MGERVKESVKEAAELSGCHVVDFPTDTSRPLVNGGTSCAMRATIKGAEIPTQNAGHLPAN
ncbi:hypothetical protein GCM10017567_56950 [Amycolatopsis bullii]|uniref:Uncharacterized protein n=1 Tax=Amycolatopsis bullii TaxID=941987 RepID=A0ABQ3KJD1_9PSEU|nr:hypothetical protein GCM10017567_56950 [Amycolatopsis bullii]